MSHAETTQIANENREIINPSTEETLYTIKGLFSRLFQILRPLNVTAGAGNSHLSIDIGKIQWINPNAATIWAVGTVSTVANQTFSGWVSTFLNEKNLSHMAYQNNIRSHIYFN